MSWRITYWRRANPLRVTKVEEATRDEIELLLQKLVANQLDLEYLHASEGDTDRPQNPEIRSNRSGTLLWTTGRDFHYTAEWFVRSDRGKQGR